MSLYQVGGEEDTLTQRFYTEIDLRMCSCVAVESFIGTEVKSSRETSGQCSEWTGEVWRAYVSVSPAG